MIKEKVSMLRSGQLTAAENMQNFLKVIGEKDEQVNAFIHVNSNAVNEATAVDEKIKSGKAGRLAGLAIAIKSVISVKDMPVTCASQTLENHIGTFDADVVARIKAEDGIIIGMTNMDEFCCGNTGETSAFGPTNNPAAPGIIPGGTSSGSAAAVAAGMCDIALGTDTGGSVRNPASHCGVFGFKPSYGRISRYGLVDMGMSLEGVGILCNDAYGIALMMEVVAGQSVYDATTLDSEVPEYSRDLSAPKKLHIGLSREMQALTTDERIRILIEASIKKLAKSLNAEIKDIKLKYVDLAVQAYYPIVYVEFFSATRKFDGRKYGKKIEDACGEEVLRRILGGREISRAEYRGTYYRKALKAKKLIEQDFRRAFDDVDIILTAVTPNVPQRIGEKISDPKVLYAQDALTAPANLAGICGGVVNAGTIDGIPIGLQILGPGLGEQVVLKVMHSFWGIKNAGA